MILDEMMIHDEMFVATFAKAIHLKHAPSLHGLWVVGSDWLKLVQSQRDIGPLRANRVWLCEAKVLQEVVTSEPSCCAVKS